jgi:hypothetical protein
MRPRSTAAVEAVGRRAFGVASATVTGIEDPRLREALDEICAINTELLRRREELG